ncbi:acyltransferase family protein [Paractinoplanes durhamensis]|uniref:acyltransferase family protein n=1 Tax=Paractinoplanes durhamensis TaxID=113563 RepID=UPI0031D442C8
MRNRYLDLLRAAAIVRVIVYHLFGWPWLSIVLPAMGIMFALAGSLTAASLEKRSSGQVVLSRVRRLLPPLWLLGLVAVPVMLAIGWMHETDSDHPFSVGGLFFWLLPIGDPTGSDAAIDVWEPLWYLRAYLWFVLLSPFMYALYQRIGWLAVAAPLLLMGVLDVTGFTLPDTADSALWDFVTYGACWIAGFAHHDGRLARLKPWIVYPVAVVMGVAAMYWLRDNQGEDPWDLNDVAESQALWSIAFVLIVLRWQPAMEWLAKVRPLDRAVTLLNARAVTVYLWHNIAIAAVWPVLTFVALDDLEGDLAIVVDFSVAMALTMIAVLLFGWAEDLAARRSPRWWPIGGRPPVAAVPASADPDPAPAPRPGDDPAEPPQPVVDFAAAIQPQPLPPVPAAAMPPDAEPAPAPGPAPRAAPDPGPEPVAAVPLGRHASLGEDTRAGLGMPVAGRPAAHHPPGEVVDRAGRSWPTGPTAVGWPEETPDWFRGRRGSDQPEQ